MATRSLAAGRPQRMDVLRSVAVAALAATIILAWGGSALSAPVSLIVVDDPSGMVTIMATSSVMVAKGELKNAKGEVTRSTSDAGLTGQQNHVKAYNGPTTFKATYTIVFKADGVTVDSTQSSVTFVTVNYTDGTKADGKPNIVSSSFTTTAIPITSATLNPDKSIASFTFSSPDKWYDPNGAGANTVTSMGLNGSINLKTGMSSYTAVYQYKPNATINTYTVTAPITGGGGGGPAGGHKPGPDFAPASPEPASWIMLLIGVACLAAQASYQRRKTRLRA